MEADEEALGGGESKFAKALANNDVRVRDLAVSALQTWLRARTEVSELDMLKLWKGLFYAMWHADKAPVQALPAAVGSPLPAERGCWQRFVFAMVCPRLHARA